MGNNQTKCELSEKLIRDIKGNDVYSASIEDIERLIHEGAAVNKRHDGTLPLHRVCMYKDIHCVRLLLKHGAKVNKVDEFRQTALHCVAKRNSDCVEIVKELILHRADINARNGYNKTPLQCAAENNNVECAKLLLEHGADINVSVEDYKTLLHWAAYSNTFTCVKFLLQHGAADVNVRDRYNYTPLHWAVYHSNVECVKLLLQHGADSNARDEYNTAPLRLAVYHNCAECVQLLLQYGADINVRDEDCFTPLRVAIDRDSVACVKTLLKHGANVNGRYKDNVLHWAVDTHNERWVKIMLQHGSNVEVIDTNHNTALNKAAGHCHLGIIKTLLEYNANVDNKNFNGQTPLMLSAIKVSKLNAEHTTACLELLIQASGQFDLPDDLIQDIACDNELSEMLISCCVQPRSLQVLCRYQIRSSLRHNFLPDVVPLLNLPQRLRTFLLLR